MAKLPTIVEVETLLISDHDYRSILTSLVDYEVAGTWTDDDIRGIAIRMLDASSRTLEPNTFCKVVTRAGWLRIARWTGAPPLQAMFLASAISSCVLVSGITNDTGQALQE